MFLDGKIVGSIDVARIPVDCPALFSKRMMKEWEMLLDFCKQETTIRRFNCVVPFLNSVPVLDVFQMPANLNRLQVPPCFHLLEHDSSRTDRHHTHYTSSTLEDQLFE